MPLTLVTGPANAAKAGVVLDAYRAAAARDPLLVVPTRADAARYERELAESGAVFAGRVVAAGQLAEQIAAAVGHNARRAGRLLRERLIVAATRDIKPAALASAASAPGFLEPAGRFISELQAERVTPAQLAAACRGRVGRELVTLYQAYQRRLARAGVEDRELYFWRALDALRTAPQRWGARPVYFYGFDDLTRLERDAVEALSRRANADVWVSLAFEPGRAALESRAFTYNELRLIADSHHELGALAEHYEPAAREPLHTLERSLFEPQSAGATPVDAGDVVELLEAGGERAEVELVAAWLRERLEEGMAPEELALVERSPERRATLLRSVFAAYGVPVALDVVRPFGHTALGRGLLGLLRCSLDPEHSASDDLLEWLRAPGVLDRPALADTLEADLRRGGVRGAAEARARWEQAHPRFKLAELDALASAAGRGRRALLHETTRQLERLLGAPRRRQAAALEGEERIDARAYASARAALEELAALPAARDVPQPDARELIELLAALPVSDGVEPGPGRVTVCDPLRVRAQRYRAVVIAGLQEGELPRSAAPDGFLSEHERQALAAAGVPLRPRDDPLGDERALFYAIASRPTARLALAYRICDEDGSATQPSFFIDDVAALYDKPLRRRRRPLADVVWDVAAAPTVRERQRAAAAAAAPLRPAAPLAVTDAAALGVLAGIERLSAGSLECFGDCGVKWLVERWLRLQRLEPEPEPMLRGRLLHAALERTLVGLREARGSAALGEEALAQATTLFASALRAAAAEEGVGEHTAAERAMLTRLERQGERVLAFEAEHGGGWEPTHLELGFGMGDEMPALELSSDLGVHGRIDRVDVAPDGRRAAVRDYKSSGGPPQARWAADGSLQVALYMLAVQELLGLDPVAGVYQPLTGSDLRPRGILLNDDGPPGEFVHEDRVDGATLDACLQDARTRALALAAELRSGAVLPRPESCARQGCRYPGVCRASAR